MTLGSYTFTTGTSTTTSNNDIGKLYTSGTITLGSKNTAATTLKNLTDNIASSMSRYLGTDTSDAKAWQAACDSYYTAQQNLCGGSDDDSLKNGSVQGLTKSGDNYVISVKDMIDTILENYRDSSGTYTQNSSSSGNAGIAYTIHDEEDDEWKEWKTEYEAWKAERDAVKAELSAATDTDNQALTNTQEQAIAFYDQLFTAVADNGWTCDSQVSDNDYLNQMMQNGLYSITTMSEEEAEDSEGNEYNYYEYSTSPAVNFDKVFQVNDTDAQEEAQVNYEYEKSVINEKETRIDTRMQDLETEQSAIKTMLEGIQSVENDNIDRTMNFCA